jgi:hypothetical protein
MDTQVLALFEFVVGLVVVGIAASVFRALTANPGIRLFCAGLAFWSLGLRCVWDSDGWIALWMSTFIGDIPQSWIDVLLFLVALGVSALVFWLSIGRRTDLRARHPSR